MPHTPSFSPHTPLTWWLQDVAEALRRLPTQEVLNRNARLKRAMDLSLKGTKLPQELQELQTPFDHYLRVRRGAAAVATVVCHSDSCLFQGDGGDDNADSELGGGS